MYGWLNANIQEVQGDNWAMWHSGHSNTHNKKYAYAE